MQVQTYNPLRGSHDFRKKIIMNKFKSQRPPQQTSFKDNKGTGIEVNDVTLPF